MKVFKVNNFDKKTEEKDYIYKGNRILPDLKTAIFANIKGYINGAYPEPLTGIAKELGYYPLSLATDIEIEQINNIEKQLLGEK